MDWRVLGMSLGFNIWRCSFFLFWSFIFCSIFLFLCRFLKMENRWQELHPLQKWEVTEVCPDWPWECKQMTVREVRFCFSSQMNVWYYRYNTKPVRGRSCTATSSTVLNWWLEKVTTTFILSEQRQILLNHCHHHNFAFFFFYRLNYHDRHDMNSWMEMHLPSSLYIHTLLDERSMRSLESAATSSWQKKKWKHHNHKENNKQTKTWKATPEEDENDDTFTGWVSSCENSSSDHLWRTSSYFCVSTEISQQQLMILFLTWQVATLRSASHSSFSSRAVIHSLLVLVFATIHI